MNDILLKIFRFLNFNMFNLNIALWVIFMVEQIISASIEKHFYGHTFMHVFDVFAAICIWTVGMYLAGIMVAVESLVIDHEKKKNKLP